VSKNKDRTPPEVKAARKRKEGRRLLVGLGFFALWWALFITGLFIKSPALVWAGWLALSGEFVVLYGLHEKVLRQITGRPAPDYNLIRRLERTEKRTRPAVAEPDTADMPRLDAS
jgi:hypothetical protein